MEHSWLPLYKNTAGNMKINYTVITVGKTRILTIPESKKWKYGFAEGSWPQSLGI